MTLQHAKNWKRSTSARNCLASREVHHAAERLAQEHDLHLRRVTDGHYILTAKGKWLVNLHPAQQMLCWDRELPERDIFQIRRPWNVLEAVQAAVIAMGSTP